MAVNKFILFFFLVQWKLDSLTYGLDWKMCLVFLLEFSECVDDVFLGWFLNVILGSF